jgi:hypothetical protein
MLLGQIQNGVIVIDDLPPTPDGTVVRVLFPDPPPADSGFRVHFPLLHCGGPSTLDLNNEKIAKIFMDEDRVLAGY